MRFRVAREDDEHYEVGWRPLITRPQWLTWHNAAFVVAGLALFVAGMGVDGISGCDVRVPRFECAPPDTRPTPGPTTPQPKGLKHAVLVYESGADKTSAGIWADAEVVAYLESKIPGGYRLYDQNAKLDDTAPAWLKEAAAVPRSVVPILVLQDASGKWYTVPWPKSKSEAMAILKKAGDA
jgi:hypothetical protein